MCEHTLPWNISDFCLKIGFSPFKNFFHLVQWKPFKIDQMCFLFHLKSSCSQDISILDLTFWSCKKTAWFERFSKLKSLFSKFMTSQTVTKQFQCTYCPIPQSKDNQAIKMFFFKNQPKTGRETSSRPLFCFVFWKSFIV